MTPPEIVGMAKDALTGIAAVGAVVVGAMGLSTWKRQLHGNANYEVSRRLLRALYMLREGIRHVRNPFIFPGEVIAARKGAGLDEASPSKQDDNRLTYQARWQKAVDARIEFEAELLEAEVLWGPEIRTLAMALFCCIGELRISLERWLSRGDEPFEAGEGTKITAVIYESGEAADEYANRLNAAVKGIEAVIRTHLKF